MDRKQAAKKKHHENQEKAKDYKGGAESDYLVVTTILSVILVTGLTIGARNDYDKPPPDKCNRGKTNT